MSVPLEQVEELLELWWTAAEDGWPALDRARLPERLVCYVPCPIEAGAQDPQETIEWMIACDLLVSRAEGLALSDAGRDRAQAIVRRHRLAEVLLDSVLEVSDDAVESTACQAEHILNDEVTEAVCGFLGHPPSCPHGRAIPRGACCDDPEAAARALLVPLTRLAVGAEATVVFMRTRHHEQLQRLHGVGLVPGCRLRLRQAMPALIVQLGEMELAMDRRLGQTIFVRRRPPRRMGTPGHGCGRIESEAEGGRMTGWMRRVRWEAP